MNNVIDQLNELQPRKPRSQCYVCRMGGDTVEAVNRAISRGVTQQDIATTIGVKVDSVRRHAKLHMEAKS